MHKFYVQVTVIGRFEVKNRLIHTMKWAIFGGVEKWSLFFVF